MTDTGSDVSEASATSTNNSGPRRGTVVRKHSRRQSSISEKYDMVKSAASHWRKGSGGSAGAGSLDFSTAFLPGLAQMTDELEPPTADEEISLISSMKEKLDKFWNTHIDIENNQDCDVEEWVMRLKALNVNLTEEEMIAFFNRVDDGQAQFLDRNEFIQFMNHQFQNEELLKYQNAIFDKIDGAKPRGQQNNLLQPSAANNIANTNKNGNNNQANGNAPNGNASNDGDNKDDENHERSHSNLVTGDDNELDEVQLHLMKQQFTRELKRQQTGHYKKLSVTESLLETIKTEEDEHPERFDETNIRNWQHTEVTAWILNNFEVNLEQVPSLVRKQGITGTNLLYDVDEATLRTVGFTPTQARDCMRYIEELREAHRTILQDSTFDQIQQMSIIFEPGPEISPEATPEPLEASERSDGLDPLTVTIPEIKHTLSKHTSSYASIKPNAVKEFLETLTLLKNKSKHFCIKTKNAVKKWTREEVAYWAKESGFEKYCYAFYIQDVTGSMLIQDLTKDALVKDIGTSNIHASSILRTIKELEEYVLNYKNDPNYKEYKIQENVYGNNIHFESEYNQILDEIENEKKELEDRVRELETELNEKNEQLQEANEKLSAMRDEDEQENNNNDENENENDNNNNDNENENEENNDNKQDEQEMEPVKNYDEMSLEDLEIELQIQKAKVSEIETLIKDKTPKSEDIIAMEELMKAEYNGNLDVIPTSSQAQSWKVVSVGAWMRNVIKLPEYIGHIYRMKIDGEIILEDWRSKEYITELLDLPDKELHVKHIFREANKLRDACGVTDSMDNSINAGKGAQKPLDKMNMKELRERVEILNDNVKDKEQEIMNLELKNDELINNFQKLEDGQSTLTDKITKLEEEKKNLQQTDAALKSELAHLHDVQIENNELKSTLEVFEKAKIDTIQDLCMEMDTLRKASRIMSKQIIYLQDTLKNSGFHPMESILTYMGYEKSTTR